MPNYKAILSGLIGSLISMACQTIFMAFEDWYVILLTLFTLLYYWKFSISTKVVIC